MAEILLLRVRYAKRFASMLDERGYDAQRLLQLAGLGPAALDNEDAWMPVSQLCRFLGVAVAETGYKTLGLDAGIKVRQKHSAFSRRVLYSPTLYQSLRQLTVNAPLEDVSAKFRVTREGDDGWMRCGSIDASDEGIRQIETFRYAAIVEIIRSAAGPEWVPSTLRLQSTTDRSIATADLLQGVDVGFGARGLSFAIEPVLFSRPMFDVPDLPTSTSRFNTPPMELPEVLREVVRTHVLAGRNTINDAAGALGVAPRTLQRSLAEYDLSYSRLLENVRIDTAKNRLVENMEPIATIAKDLGYKHSTHFSRAFRRVCGITPREFRKLRPLN